MNDFQQSVWLLDIISELSVFLEQKNWITLYVSLTPAAVKQEVNFLESSEISLHKTTVNLKTEDIKSDLARLLIKLHQLLNQKKKKDLFIFAYAHQLYGSENQERVQSVELQRGLQKYATG